MARSKNTDSTRPFFPRNVDLAYEYFTTIRVKGSQPINQNELAMNMKLLSMNMNMLSKMSHPHSKIITSRMKMSCHVIERIGGEQIPIYLGNNKKIKKY